MLSKMRRWCSIRYFYCELLLDINLCVLECCVNLLYFVFNIFFKVFNTDFAMVHLQGVRDISIRKRTVYTPSWRNMCVYHFSIRSLTFFLSLHFIPFFFLCYSSTGNKMLSKSMDCINGTLKRCYSSWKCSHFSFLEGLFTLTWPLLRQYS